MIIQDEKKTYHSLVTILLKQIYETLISTAQKHGGKLPVRTNFILDEFANMPPLKDVTTMVTAEPLLSFDLEQMLEYIKRCNPKKVNIGRNSCRSIELPEPSKDEVKLLIEGLKDISKIEIKKNAKLWMA